MTHTAAFALYPWTRYGRPRLTLRCPTNRRPGKLFDSLRLVNLRLATWKERVKTTAAANYVYTILTIRGRKEIRWREGGSLSHRRTMRRGIYSRNALLLLCSELSAWSELDLSFSICLYIVRSVDEPTGISLCVSDGRTRTYYILQGPAFNFALVFFFTWRAFIFDDEILLKQQQTTTDPVIIITQLSWLSGSKTIARSSPKNLYMSLIATSVWGGIFYMKHTHTEREREKEDAILHYYSRYSI